MHHGDDEGKVENQNYGIYIGSEPQYYSQIKLKILIIAPAIPDIHQIRKSVS